MEVQEAARALKTMYHGADNTGLQMKAATMYTKVCAANDGWRFALTQGILDPKKFKKQRAAYERIGAKAQDETIEFMDWAEKQYDKYQAKKEIIDSVNKEFNKLDISSAKGGTSELKQMADIKLNIDWSAESLVKGLVSGGISIYDYYYKKNKQEREDGVARLNQELAWTKWDELALWTVADNAN